MTLCAAVGSCNSRTARETCSKHKISSKNQSVHIQALLDLYTIRRELGRLNDFKIAMIGDLLNGRTVHSLAYLLSKYENVEMVFVSPEILKLKPDLKEYLTSAGVRWREESSLEAAVAEVDVLYQTRIQKERFLVRAHCLSFISVLVLLWILLCLHSLVIATRSCATIARI
jgi:hypothetical protein